VKLLKKCLEWYLLPENRAGGCLHIILDDGNVDNDDLLFCLNNTKDEKAIDILEGLQKLHVSKRKWVVQNIHNNLTREGQS